MLNGLFFLAASRTRDASAVERMDGKSYLKLLWTAVEYHHEYSKMH